MSDLQLQWQEDGQTHAAFWQTDNGARLPSRVQTVKQLDADTAYRLASAGTGLLWRGDFQQAKQLLQGMSQRMDAMQQRKHVRLAAAERQSERESGGGHRQWLLRERQHQVAQCRCGEGCRQYLPKPNSTSFQRRQRQLHWNSQGQECWHPIHLQDMRELGFFR